MNCRHSIEIERVSLSPFGIGAVGTEKRPPLVVVIGLGEYICKLETHRHKSNLWRPRTFADL